MDWTALRVPESTATARLARAIQSIATTAGDHITALPELTLHRRNAPTDASHCIHTVFTLGLVVTVQGNKQVTLGNRVISYGPGDSMLTTIDIPLVAHVTRATARDPYLGIMIRIDANTVIRTASEIEVPRFPKEASYEPISIQRVDSQVLEALYHLLQLLDEPVLLPHIAPLVTKEIIIRLLTGPHAFHLWQLVAGTDTRKHVVKAVSHIMRHFSQSIRIDTLAEDANMSPTTFRQYFREMTGMSPVQYQKLLRLQEARQLMLNQDVTAGSACALVGYESASQFNREYRRLFGAPPQADIRRIRSQ